MLLTFSMLGLLFLLKFHETDSFSCRWFVYGLLAAIFYTSAVSVKFVGFYSCCLGGVTLCRHLWKLLPDKHLSLFKIEMHLIARVLLFLLFPVGMYLGVFYLHLGVLYKAGPHDSIMTSAFQVKYEKFV